MLFLSASFFKFAVLESDRCNQKLVGWLHQCPARAHKGKLSTVRKLSRRKDPRTQPSYLHNQTITIDIWIFAD